MALQEVYDLETDQETSYAMHCRAADDNQTTMEWTYSIYTKKRDARRPRAAQHVVTGVRPMLGAPAKATLWRKSKYEYTKIGRYPESCDVAQSVGPIPVRAARYLRDIYV